jgi:XXXCH domain-containing protein
MGRKVERSFAREELADYLAELSQQLRRGSLEAGGRLWAVPEQVYAKIGFKEEDGAVAVKISWQWSTREARHGDSEKPASPPAQTPAPSKPASFKEVKVRLAASFKNLQRRLEEGLLPEAQMMQGFVEGSRAMAEFAQSEWRQPMREYLTHLENLQQAVENRQLEVARRALQQLADCMASCHREFK